MLKRFVRFVAWSGLVAGGLLGAGSACQAAFAVTATPGGSALAGFNYATFDLAALGSASATSGGVTATFAGGSAVVNGSVANQYAAPIITGANNTFFGPATMGADTTNYLSAATGSVTLTFAGGAQTYLGLLWGSVDSFNLLSFFDATGNSVGQITGAQIIALEGGSAAPGTYVNIRSTIAFTRVVASSPTNSFEFDNVAYGNVAVPEPSSLLLCGLAGLVGLSVTRARGLSAIG